MSGGAPPRAEIEFPVKWRFRIIVEAARSDEAVPVLQEVLLAAGKPAELEPGRVSAGGHYVTWEVETQLLDRRELEELPVRLCAVAGVKTVL